MPMKMKLLSPAGEMESLKMAVSYGADEVYLGVKNFNARNIEGFNLETLKEAVSYAHLHNVRIHLAVNILFDDEELQNALNLVVDAYNIGVDAFIIQDLGLAHLININYPQIEMHASTQMAIHNLEGALQAKNLGFKRIVLARETPLAEIKRIKENCDVEIEYFAQGALCVCFSGNCYISSKLYSASGNRGKCKQVCRLPYSLYNGKTLIKNGYLLSAKDFNMAKRLKDLEEAGVDAIKIEGRARRPFYVAVATDTYRKLLDENEYNKENLEIAFNRNYTEGYFNGNNNIISNFNNHIGLYIGKVEKITIGKKFNELFFTSSRELSKRSSIKLFSDGKELCTIALFDLKKIGENKYYATTMQNIKNGAEVRLIEDYNFEEVLCNNVKKKKIKIEIDAFKSKQIEAKFEDFELFGDVLEPAQNQPLSYNDVITCFNKSEYFECEVNFKTDGVFIPKSKLNEFRRNFYEKLFEKLTQFNGQKLEKIIVQTNLPFKKFENFEVIEDFSNKKLEKENIIYSPEVYTLENIKKFMEICAKCGKNPLLDTPNFALKADIELLSDIIEKTGISIVANNYYALSLQTKKVAGGLLNVYNSVSANYLNIPILSAENELSNHIDVPLMTLRHCPMKEHLGANCSACPYNNNFKFVMQNGKELKLKRKKLTSCTFYLC